MKSFGRIALVVLAVTTIVVTWNVMPTRARARPAARTPRAAAPAAPEKNATNAWRDFEVTMRPAVGAIAFSVDVAAWTGRKIRLAPAEQVVRVKAEVFEPQVRFPAKDEAPIATYYSAPIPLLADTGHEETVDFKVDVPAHTLKYPVRVSIETVEPVAAVGRDGAAFEPDVYSSQFLRVKVD